MFGTGEYGGRGGVVEDGGDVWGEAGGKVREFDALLNVPFASANVSQDSDRLGDTELSHQDK